MLLLASRIHPRGKASGMNSRMHSICGANSSLIKFALMPHLIPRQLRCGDMDEAKLLFFKLYECKSTKNAPTEVCYSVDKIWSNPSI